MYEKIIEKQNRLNYDNVVDGTNISDLVDDRPEYLLIMKIIF